MKKMMSDEYAVYLPAVNSTYANCITKPILPNRPFPNTIQLTDLEFWNKNSKLFYHPHYLHSVGQYSVGKAPDNAVTRRGKTDGVLIGDSGGFQIGKGRLKGIVGLRNGLSADAIFEVWHDAYDAKQWIMSWLETYTNYAMTIDMPLWSTTAKGNESPFHVCSIQQLTDLTVDNLKFIDTYRQHKTKWLNVLQGVDRQGVINWWNAVKWFDCSGYALGGNAGHYGGLKNTLATLLMLRDDNALIAGRDWIHILGVSTTKWAVMSTAMQTALQSINSNIRVSFDSASPFQTAGRGEEYVITPNFGLDKKDWVLRSTKCPQSTLHFGSNEPLPFSSPLANKLTLGDLNITNDIFANKQFDSLSCTILCNHNVWSFLDAFQTANNLVFANNRSEVPTLLIQCVDFVAEVFTAPDWQTALDNNTQLLTEFDKW
jgi:hypothetical protein